MSLSPAESLLSKTKENLHHLQENVGNLSLKDKNQEIIDKTIKIAEACFEIALYLELYRSKKHYVEVKLNTEIELTHGRNKEQAMSLPNIMTFVSILTATLDKANQPQKLQTVQIGAINLSFFCMALKQKYESKWGNGLTGKICFFVYKLFNINNTRTTLNSFNTSIQALQKTSDFDLDERAYTIKKQMAFARSTELKPRVFI